MLGGGGLPGGLLGGMLGEGVAGGEGITGWRRRSMFGSMSTGVLGFGGLSVGTQLASGMKRSGPRSLTEVTCAPSSTKRIRCAKSSPLSPKLDCQHRTDQSGRVWVPVRGAQVGLPRR
jgi:hypothetical protein